jgi:Icc-related predicted phosphoesterase
LTFRRENKTLGVDLFDGEALTQDDVTRACLAGKVDVLISHDAPTGAPIPARLLPGPDADHRLLVARVVEQLQPSLVVHGHYHREYDHRPLSGPRIVGLGRDRDGTSDLCILNLADLSVVSRYRTVGPAA